MPRCGAVLDVEGNSIDEASETYDDVIGGNDAGLEEYEEQGSVDLLSIVYIVNNGDVHDNEFIHWPAKMINKRPERIIRIISSPQFNENSERKMKSEQNS